MSAEINEMGSVVSGTAVTKLGALAKAYIAAKQEMAPLVTTKTAEVATKSGGKYHYNYTELAEVYDVCETALGNHGIAVFQDVYTLYDGPTPEVECFTTLYHADSDQYRSNGRISLRSAEARPTPQDMGSLITYTRRYSLLAAVGLAPEDDDGKNASTRAEQPRATQPRITNGAPGATKVANGAPATPAAGAPATPKSEEELRRSLDTLGKELYGEEWGRVCLHNVKTKFGEDKSGVGDLNAEQLNKLIRGLQTLKNQNAAKVQG